MLIVRDGYRAATITAIASAAEVNVDTVYELVGRKPVLLRELIEEAISGTDHPVVAEERAHIVAMLAERDPAAKLAIYAHALADTHRRLAPLFAAARDAASTEPEAAQVWREISERRAANMRKLVADVRAGLDGPFELPLERAADVAWALNAPELYLMLTGERGWSPLEYERFVADAMHRLLLAELDG